MKKVEYRIREYNGNFAVQKKVIKRTGRLWWKKEEIDWQSITAFGDPIGGYSSLKKAKTACNVIRRGFIYHYDILHHIPPIDNSIPSSLPCRLRDNKKG